MKLLAMGRQLIKAIINSIVNEKGRDDRYGKHLFENSVVQINENVPTRIGRFSAHSFTTILKTDLFSPFTNLDFGIALIHYNSADRRIALSRHSLGYVLEVATTVLNPELTIILPVLNRARQVLVGYYIIKTDTEPEYYEFVARKQVNFTVGNPKRRIQGASREIYYHCIRIVQEHCNINGNRILSEREFQIRINKFIDIILNK